MSDKKPYILEWSNTSIQLVGPYPSVEQASKDGHIRQEEGVNKGSPCWHIVELTEAQVTNELPNILPNRNHEKVCVKTFSDIEKVLNTPSKENNLNPDYNVLKVGNTFTLIVVNGVEALSIKVGDYIIYDSRYLFGIKILKY